MQNCASTNQIKQTERLNMHNTIQWQCLFFDQLNVHQLYALLAARHEVFVIEQNCIYQDKDNIDQDCHHLIAWTQEGKVAAYARLVPPGKIFKEASIGRVLTTTVGRGAGLGKQLISKSIEEIQQLYANDGVKIAAQQYLEHFYQSFGFKTVSAMYLEDNIPHVEMILE